MPSQSSCILRFCKIALCAWSIVDAGFGGPGEVEIEFAPMDMDERGGPPDAIMQLLAGADSDGDPIGPARRGAGARHGPGQGGREAELDNMLASAFGGMFGPGAGRPRPGGPGGPGVTEEIVLEGPDGTQVMEMGGPSGPGDAQVMEMHGRSKLPGALIRDLFPGAMLAPGGPVVVDGAEGRGAFGPDPLMMDVMQDLDRSFTEEMLPAIRKAAAGERDPGACQEDVKKNCAGAKSHLHCLGVHHEKISDACRKEVGQSVPFRCSAAIDRFCDVLETGILSCLYNHMQDLDGQCRDAVLTTKHVINKVNTQRASLVDTTTGTKQVHTPTAAARESALDAKLGLRKVAATNEITQMQRPVSAAAPKAAPAAKEATLDAKLGLSQSAALRRTAASASSPGQLLNAMAPIEAAPLSSADEYHFTSHIHRFGGVFILISAALLAYIFANSEFTKPVYSQIVGHNFEGAKLLHTSVELPKPDAM